jgi:ATP-dependent helicase/nuclease subunit A
MWNPVTNVFQELYDYLYHLAVKADNANEGLAAFTDSMNEFRDAGGHFTEFEIPMERPGAVHLLTIHKSKGLEFPVVFLCGCGKHSQSDKSDIYFYSDNTGVVFKPPLPSECLSIPDIQNNFFWEQVKNEKRKKRTAELRRLLYVGMTRAEKELYVTGSLKINISGNSDDFSLVIKNYIESKIINNENEINGDSILNNDTFFGLLLPAVVSNIPLEGLKSDNVFFSLNEIPVYTENYIKKQETKGLVFSNDQTGLNDYLKKVESYYQNTEKILTPVLRNNHITPVSLREIGANQHKDSSGVNFLINKEFSGAKSDDVFLGVDSLLARFSQTGDEYSETFNSGSFGTIAHICVEAYLNDTEPVIPPNVTGSLTPAEVETFLNAGKELALRFLNSPFGKSAIDAKVRESEFAFRSIITNKAGDEYFINGVIDLFFDDGKTIHVVDFKTDNREIPAEHIQQMACYYRAVFDLFAEPSGKNCRVWLYYLRSGHAVELTEEVKLSNLLI